MADLINKYIYETYKGLIKTLDNEPINGALKPLSDGEGNPLPIKVSETDVEVGFLTSKNLFIEEYGEVIDQNGNWTGPSAGLSGTSGTSGTSGATGTSGTSGVNGSSGQTGTAGTSGTSGTKGSSGTSGINGSSGNTGTSGTSGQAGSSGTAGTSGTNGSSGMSALGLPSKVITTDNQGWTFDGSTNAKTFNFGSAFANTNYSVDFTYDISDVPATVFSNTGVYTINFTNKTTTSITVVVYIGAAISDFTFNGFLTLIATGESAGSGTSGTSGQTGSSGTSGQNGINGANGSSGTSGTSGTSGQAGTAGTSGQNGTAGTSGVAGTSGTNGTSGTSGLNGTSGTAGTSGVAGTSGTTPVGTIATAGPNTITNVWSGTQAQYTALGTYSATILYFIE